jgi:hypothetical protein
LLLVGLLAFALLWAADKYLARPGRHHDRSFKALSLALVAQVIIVMASAFDRLYIYEQAYGFTTLRLYSHAFTVLLAAVFLLLAYKIARSSTDQAFALASFIAVCAFLAALDVLNPDAFIARQNIQRLQSTGKVDGAYLGSLSADAVPALLAEYRSFPGDERTAAGAGLYRLSQDADHDWRSWNWSRQHAADMLASQRAELQQYAHVPVPGESEQ